MPQSNLGADDAGGVEWVIRRYVWMAVALPEAKLSVKRLRDVFFGRGHQAKTLPEPEASSTSSEARSEEAGGGAEAPGAQAAAGFEAVGRAAGAEAPESEA